MSETQSTPPRSKDESLKNPEYVKGLPEALQIDAIDELRAKQAVYEREYAEKQLKENDTSPFDLDASEKAYQAAHEDFDDLIKKHLESHNIDENNSEYENYTKLLRGYSIDTLPTSEWDTGSADKDGTIKLPARQEAIRTLRSTYEIPEPQQPETTNVLQSEALKEQRKTVAGLRDELAELAAKRQSRLLSRSKTKEAYEAKLREYRDAVDALTLAELEAEKDPNKYRSEDELRMSAASKLIGEFKSLQEKSVEILQNTKASWFINYMTKGGKIKRAAKGIALGAVIGVGGALLAGGVGLVAAGGAVVVAGGAATAGVVAGRFARAYATMDNKAGRGLKVIEANDETRAEAIDKSGAEDFSEREDIVEGINEYLLGTLEGDITKEQSKRRRSAAKAVGMVAVGAVVGATGAHLIGEVANAWSTPITTDAGPDDHIYDSAESQDDTAGDSTEAEPTEEKEEYSAEALTMSSGEGFYSTFESLDIPQKDWPELLNKAGPELHDMQVDGHPLAYEMPNGQWGLNMTSDGTFPQEGLDKIMNLHDEMTGEATPSTSVEDAQDSDVTPETETETAPPDTDTESSPTPIEGSEIQNVMDKSRINPSDIEGNAALTDLTHVAVWQSPDVIGEKLGLSLAQWENLQDHIAAETVNNNRLYTDVFRVSDTGYLHFKTPTIPAATMADMLNNIPLSVRQGL